MYEKFLIPESRKVLSPKRKGGAGKRGYSKVPDRVRAKFLTKLAEIRDGKPRPSYSEGLRKAMLRSEFPLKIGRARQIGKEAGVVW
jgi:hypothetical protein